MAKKENLFKADSAVVAYGIYGAVGFQLAGAVVGGLLLGNWLDGKCGTSPWIALGGLVVGSVGGFYNLIRLLSWNQARKDQIEQGKMKGPSDGV